MKNIATEALYRRHPLPRNAQVSGVATLLLWMLVVLSPFVSFTVNGKVDGSNWTPAIVTACLALAILVGLNIRAGIGWRALPASLRDEYSFGRLMPPLPQDDAAEPMLPFGPRQRFTLVAGLTPRGVWFDQIAMSGASRLMRRDLDRLARRESSSSHRIHELPWSDIVEWEVHEDTDNVDTYKLVRADRSWVRLKRPSNPADERRLLDYVRRAGQCPVRLFCDVE